MPEPSLTALCVFSIRTGLDASTVTPGSTAPDTSLTTPLMEAWANAAAGVRTNANKTSHRTLNARMKFSLRHAIAGHVFTRGLRASYTPLTVCKQPLFDL